jgi:CBS domain-containing protein
MKCEDIMTTNLEWLSPEDTILKAASVMSEAGVGFLPICDAGRMVVGVVTDRDLTTRALAKGLPAATTPVHAIMSAPAITCTATAALEDAEALMATECKQRLVMTDADGRLVGVLGLADLIEKAEGREVMRTLKAVLWREALGPRGGAERGAPLLKNDPAASRPDAVGEPLQVRESVFISGPRPDPDFNKVFP